MALRGMSEGWGRVGWLVVGWLVGAARAYRPGEEYIPVNRWEGEEGVSSCFPGTTPLLTLTPSQTWSAR